MPERSIVDYNTRYFVERGKTRVGFRFDVIYHNLPVHENVLLSTRPNLQSQNLQLRRHPLVCTNLLWLGSVFVTMFRFSGVTAELLRGVTTTIREVQAVLLSMIHKDTILVGHSLESDLKATKVLTVVCLKIARNLSYFLFLLYFLSKPFPLMSRNTQK